MRKEDKVFFAKLILQQMRRQGIDMKEAKGRLISLALQGQDLVTRPMMLEHINQYFDEAFKNLEEDRDKNFYLITESSSGSMLRYFDDEGSDEEGDRIPVEDVWCSCNLDTAHRISTHGTSPEWDEKYRWVIPDEPKSKEYIATFYKIKESWDEDGFSAESDREAIDHGHECAMNETNQDEGVEVVLDRLEEKVSRDKNRLVYERKARRLRG